MIDTSKYVKIIHGADEKEPIKLAEKSVIKNQDKTITENGVYEADVGYTGLGVVTVEVPSYPEPTGDIEITENGNVDVKDYANAIVNIDCSVGGLDLHQMYRVVDGVLRTSGGNCVLSDDVLEISSYCFEGLSDYKTIFNSFGFNKVKKIGYAGCKNMFSNSYVKSIDVSSIEEIEESAFENLCNNSSVAGHISFDNLVKVGRMGLRSAFYNAKIESITFGSLTGEGSSIDTSSLYQLCYNCKTIKKATFSKLKVIDKNGSFFGAFYSSSVEEVDFPELQTIALEGAVESMFYSSSLSKINLPKLENVTDMKRCFWNCSKLKTISFPALKSVNTNAFDRMFAGCSALLAIHFPADMESVISSCVGYDTKFGATNATIYFDL